MFHHNFFIKNFSFYTKNSTSTHTTPSTFKQQYSYSNQLLIKQNKSKFLSITSSNNSNSKVKETNYETEKSFKSNDITIEHINKKEIADQERNKLIR